MSAIYSKLNKVAITKAVNKARDTKPRVHIDGFNSFTVSGSKGDSYHVSFTGKGETFGGDCTCPASKKNNVCYHLAAAAPIYKQQVAERNARATAELVERIEAGRVKVAELQRRITSICERCGCSDASYTSSGELLCAECKAAKANADLFE